MFIAHSPLLISYTLVLAFVNLILAKNALLLLPADLTLFVDSKAK